MEFFSREGAVERVHCSKKFKHLIYRAELRAASLGLMSLPERNRFSSFSFPSASEYTRAALLSEVFSTSSSTMGICHQGNMRADLEVGYIPVLDSTREPSFVRIYCKRWSRLSGSHTVSVFGVYTNHREIPKSSGRNCYPLKVYIWVSPVIS